MANIIKVTLDKLVAADTPNRSPLRINTEYSIHMVAQIVSENGDTVTGGILRFFPNIPVLLVMDDQGKIVAPEADFKGYTFKGDGDGNYSYWLFSRTKAPVSSYLSVEGDDESAVPVATILFSSYTGLKSDYGPPILPVDSDGFIHIDSIEPYINVRLPPSTASYKDQSGAYTALLINGATFISGLCSTIYDEGFNVPANMLVSEQVNRFGYIIYNGIQDIAPIAPSVRVIGEAMDRPPPYLRTLQQSPYLGEYAQVINDASADVPIFLDYPSDNPDGLAFGDSIRFKIYINGYIQGTPIHNNTIFALPDVAVPLHAGVPMTTSIPATKLMGFGIDEFGDPGDIYIDYELIKKDSREVYARPIKYFRGLINTVGPI